MFKYLKLTCSDYLSLIGVSFFLAQVAALKGSDHGRPTNVSTRLDAQQKKLNLPILPTTTIGSFPQTMDLRRVRWEYKDKKLAYLSGSLCCRILCYFLINF